MFLHSLKIFLICSPCFVVPALIPHATGQCEPVNGSFTPGETITYTVSYNWGPVWIDAGIVTFETRLEQKRGKAAWHLISTGRTYKSYDFLFKVRDTYESWIDTTTLRTLEFRRYVFEGGYQLQNNSWFDYSGGVVFSNTMINNGPLSVDTIRMEGCTFDMLSAVYHVRSLNLDSLKKDAPIPVHVAIDDSIYRIGIQFLGREIVAHPNGMLYPCNKFSATMVEGTIFTNGQEAFVWVSDDSNKVPVYIEAKILVGSVKAYLLEARGLRQPLEKAD